MVLDHETTRPDETRTPSPLRERSVARVVRAQPTSDGAGVRLRRSIGTPALSMLDPFLMLDEFSTDRPEEYLAGFPDHPHRGFETVSYMIEGAFEHRDNAGNHGLLGPGSVQWMTAGRGVIHSEMPKQEKGKLHGFQLWLNLPAAQKMIPPRYQDIPAERIPEVRVGDARVRVIAGEVFAAPSPSGEGSTEPLARGPVTDIVTAPRMLDVTVAAGGAFAQPIPAGHTAFLYVFEGEVTVGAERRTVGAQELAVLDAGDVLRVASAGGGRFLLLAAQPIREPVARYGPFVMNTEAEIRQAFLDFQQGRLTG